MDETITQGDIILQGGAPSAPVPDPFTLLINFIKDFFESGSFANHTAPVWLLNFWDIIKFAGTFVSLAIILAITFILLRSTELSKKRHAKDEAKEKEMGQRLGEAGILPVTAVAGADPMKLENLKWKRVLENSESQNPSDWRLAIMEADIILEELLTGLGYSGDTISSKLKKIERSDFTNLDKAWQAHKVRNVIAHEGSDFELSHRETRRVINLYRDVFNEYRFI